MRAVRSENICFGAAETGSIAVLGLNSPFKAEFSVTMVMFFFPSLLEKLRQRDLNMGTSRLGPSSMEKDEEREELSRILNVKVAEIDDFESEFATKVKLKFF